jgi:L-alanine-DL-glutamate epimerase-like enolase superfamily enzyme
MRNWVFVRVEADQSGLYGWGEATLEWKTRAVVGAVQDPDSGRPEPQRRIDLVCSPLQHRQEIPGDLGS